VSAVAPDRHQGAEQPHVVPRVLTSVGGPQAEAGLLVELGQAGWPAGGPQEAPLQGPRGPEVLRQLALHIQVRHRWEDSSFH